jgi:hypothetical protein
MLISREGEWLVKYIWYRVHNTCSVYTVNGYLIVQALAGGGVGERAR